MRLPLAEMSVLAVTFAWGLSFVVIPHALEDAGTFTLTALRMAVGAVAGLVLLRPDLRGTDRRTWLHGIGGGLCLTGGYLLQTAGLRTAGSGDGAFLTAFYVTLVPILDAVVHRRIPAAKDLIAVALATVGIGLIVVEPGAHVLLGTGELLIVLSAFFWAGQIVVVGRVAASADPAALAVIQVGVTAVVAAACVPFSGEGAPDWSRGLFPSVFFLGYVTCALAFAVQGWAQQKLAPTRMAVLFAPEPVFAAFAGWWFRDERFGAREFSGAALVTVAVLLVLVTPERRSTRGSGVPSAA